MCVAAQAFRRQGEADPRWSPSCFSQRVAVAGGIMIGGYGGVNVTIGEGLEMQAIAACVVAGVLLGGGKGSVPNVIFGAFTLQAIVNLLNSLGSTQTLHRCSPGFDHHRCCGLCWRLASHEEAISDHADNISHM